MSVASAHPMLELASAVAVDEFLGRQRYERRMLAEHGYRNAYGRPRPAPDAVSAA